MQLYVCLTTSIFFLKCLKMQTARVCDLEEIHLIDGSIPYPPIDFFSFDIVQSLHAPPSFSDKQLMCNEK